MKNQNVPTSNNCVQALAYTVLFFIAYDFGRFVAHSLLHDIPCLWQFHKVHHSAEVLMTGVKKLIQFE